LLLFLKRNGKYVVAGAIVALIAIGWFVSNSRSTPQGQRALVTLQVSNLATLFQEFDAASDHTRVVALLSPT